MSQTAQATGISVSFLEAEKFDPKLVKNAVAMVSHLLEKIQAPPGGYQIEHTTFESRFANFTQRHMQVALAEGDQLRVQIRAMQGNVGAFVGTLKLPADTPVHTVFRSAGRVLRELNENSWQEAIDAIPPAPPPQRSAPSGGQQLTTHAGAAVTWSRTGSGGAPAVPSTPSNRPFQPTNGPAISRTRTSPSSQTPSSTNGRALPMPDPTPQWIALLKLLLQGAERGVMPGTGVGKKALQFFPGKSAHELAPSVFPELRRRGWVRFVDPERGLWQVEQSFVDQHQLGIKLEVLPALEPLQRGVAARKKPDSPMDELGRLLDQRQKEEERIHALIHLARDHLEKAVQEAQQAMEAQIAAAEQALRDARTNGAAVVKVAEEALAAHMKKYAKELKTALSAPAKKT